MPWCDTCDEYRAPTALTTDARCGVCDDTVDVEDLQIGEQVKPPWHFWLVVVAVVAYLGWRLIEGVVWLVALI